MTGPAVKIIDLDTLVLRYGRPRTQRVVFTNGCFDILHRGHVEYLYSARDLGNALVVGVNSDSSVRRLKGAPRPIVPLDDRMFVLAGLGCVDAVTPFDDDTPLDLINALLPDVLAKGGDYEADDVVGAHEVRDAGGDVIILPFIHGRSTTGIIQNIGDAID